MPCRSPALGEPATACHEAMSARAAARLLAAAQPMHSSLSRMRMPLHVVCHHCPLLCTSLHWSETAQHDLLLLTRLDITKFYSTPQCKTVSAETARLGSARPTVGAATHQHRRPPMAESVLASSASVTFERRCRAAFEEFQSSGVLLAANFDAAFRRAGFPDARAEEVERYRNNFLQQRRGVCGSLHYPFTQNRSPATPCSPCQLCQLYQVQFAVTKLLQEPQRDCTDRRASGRACWRAESIYTIGSV